MVKAYGQFWKNWKTVDKNATRSEFWWAFLCNTLIRAIFILVGNAAYLLAIKGQLAKVSSKPTAQQTQEVITQSLSHLPLVYTIATLLGGVFSLIIMIPVTTLTARRLRDAGYSPALAYPLPAVYLANFIFLFVSLSFTSTLSLIFLGYSLALLVLCRRPTASQETFTKI